jgi:ribosome-associated protein
MIDANDDTRSTDASDDASDLRLSSRTQRKREALDLQRLGGRLADLRPADLAVIPLPDQVIEAIEAYRKIRSHEARRRQLQFLGKLMRKIDVEPITQALDRIDAQSSASSYEFHQLEIWRERLIEEPAALTEYLSAHPHADRQRLRQQLARVRKAPDEARRKAESRELFRMLRSFLSE